MISLFEECKIRSICISTNQIKLHTYVCTYYLMQGNIQKETDMEKKAFHYFSRTSSKQHLNQGGQILPLTLLQAGFKTISLEVVVEMQIFHFNSKGIPSPMSTRGGQVQVVKKGQNFVNIVCDRPLSTNLPLQVNTSQTSQDCQGTSYKLVDVEHAKSHFSSGIEAMMKNVIV